MNFQSSCVLRCNCNSHERIDLVNEMNCRLLFAILLFGAVSNCAVAVSDEEQCPSKCVCDLYDDFNRANCKFVSSPNSEMHLFSAEIDF